MALLTEKEVSLDAIGVTLRVPKGAIVERLANQTSYRIDDGNDPPRFLIRAQSMVASAARSSPQLQFDQHRDFLIEKGTEFTTLRDIDFQVSGSPAKLAFLAMPMGDGVTAITGWLLIQTGPNTFVAFSIISSGVDFPVAEEALAASFSTISLTALEHATAVQAEKLDRSKRFLASLTPQRLRAAADGKNRWYRVYRPGGGRDGGDMELGYLRIRAYEAERGEVSESSRLRSNAPPEPGLLVEVTAKLLVGGDPAHTVDVLSRYWQSWDRQSETWSMVSTERVAKQSKTQGQSGWRSPPMSTGERGSVLTVVNSELSKATSASEQLRARDEVDWEVPADGYLNQAEVILLGSLLPRDASYEGDYSFYYYDTRSNKLPQRIDRWSRETDGSGRWMLLTRPSTDSGEMKQLYTADGERVRRIDADGLVTEVIDHGDLLRIWRSKGLPTQ